MNSSGADIHTDPADVVRRFIADMHDWESQMSVAYEAAKESQQLEPFKERALASLGEVFARWCTPKDRKYGRLGSFAIPPEYQPEHETILETVIETTRRSYVFTQQGTGFKHRQRYVLLKKSGRWLIDSVKWRTRDGEWSEGTL